MQRLALGGGCHWCTEAVFQALGGVFCVRQGCARSDPPGDTWSEAGDPAFDPGRLSPHDLIAVHLATHASTSHHKLRGKYRSAIHVPDAAQPARAAESPARLSAETGADFVTRGQCMEGIPEMIPEVQVDATFPDATKLVTLHNPIR